MAFKVNKNKTLTDLEACDCRWPLGDPRQDGFHFCGARQAPGRPYCELHWQMAFLPAKSRQPAQPQATLKLVAAPLAPAKRAA